MNLPPTENILFITIGNSMESYGYILNMIFPRYMFGHIKVSRTLKDNIETSAGKENRRHFFYRYFHQKITEIIGKYSRVDAVIILDTFGAGETMSTILHSFIQKGLAGKPDLIIFPACLMEGGQTKPAPPYDENIKIVHLIRSEDFPGYLTAFRNSDNALAVMPVLTFNEYIPLQPVREEFISSTAAGPEIADTHYLVRRFGQKKLKIFLETQIVILNGMGKYIIIPSGTTRLLAHINPYFPTAQKTVFVAQDISTGRFITRDGHGYSRKEKPPMVLHRLNNDPVFSGLPISAKITLLFYKDREILKEVSEELKKIVGELGDDDLMSIRNAFDSFLRKKIIYHYLCSNKSERLK